MTLTDSERLRAWNESAKCLDELRRGLTQVVNDLGGIPADIKEELDATTKTSLKQKYGARVVSSGAEFIKITRAILDDMAVTLPKGYTEAQLREKYSISDPEEIPAE